MAQMPGIKEAQDGHVYVVVKTRRGPRARQVTNEGVRWLRQKFAADLYGSIGDIPLDYDTYWEMNRLGFIYVGAKPKRRLRYRQVAADAGFHSTKAPLRDNYWRSIYDPNVWTPSAPTEPPLIPNPTPGPAVSAGAAPPKLDPRVGVGAVSRTSNFPCLGCGTAMPDGAHFCARCGRARRRAKESNAVLPILFGLLLAFAALVFVCWKLSAS